MGKRKFDEIEADSDDENEVRNFFFGGDEEEGSEESEDLSQEEDVETAIIENIGINKTIKEEKEEILEEIISDEPKKKELLQKLHQFQLGGGAKIAWVETLVISSQEKLVLNDIDDDEEREAAFMKNSLKAVKEAEVNCEVNKIPFERPDDYYAEMTKSDAHMLKIKKQLDSQKRRLENMEEAKKLRDLKKYGKQVQVQKKKERDAEKREFKESVKKWRKDREQGNSTKELSFDEDIQPKAKRQKLTPKAAFKKEKYGFKKQDKKNTANSSHDMTGFSIKNNKSLDKDLAKGFNAKPKSRGKKQKKPRQGKSKRAAAKNRK